MGELAESLKSVPVSGNELAGALRDMREPAEAVVLQLEGETDAAERLGNAHEAYDSGAAQETR